MKMLVRGLFAQNPAYRLAHSSLTLNRPLTCTFIHATSLSFLWISAPVRKFHGPLTDQKSAQGGRQR